MNPSFSGTLRGKWESNIDGSAFRLYCESTQKELVVYPEGEAYYSNVAWGKNGEDIGRTQAYWVGPSFTTGRSVWFSANRVYSSTVSDESDYPCLNEKYYPEPITNENGDWKYKPLNPNLPRTYKCTSLPFGFITDLTFSIYKTGEVDSRGNEKFEAQITGLTFDDDDEFSTLYLQEGVIGDGNAALGTYTDRNPPHYTHSYVTWHNRYSATWIPKSRLEESVNSGVSSYPFNGTTDVVINNIEQLAIGSYSASALGDRVTFVKHGRLGCNWLYNTHYAIN